MKVLKTKSALLACLKNYKQKKSIGFVPTMGSLHEGHLKLIKASKNACEITLCSVFVNPMQFNDNNDFIRYPRNIESDLDRFKLSEIYHQVEMPALSVLVKR